MPLSPARLSLATTTAALLAGCATAPPPAARERWVEEVRAAEIAFAKTMADRDHAAFLGFVADDAVFIGSDNQPLRGKAAVGAYWKRFYSGPTAPFSWKPDLVEVLASGMLALSTGPVHAPNGKLVSRFQSTWRLDPDGRWRVVIDKGAEVCDCPARP